MWLKISNPGCFDVISAVNMLGASVKVNENPIGMFGSGTKFALAQAVRTGVPMKIYDGERMFNVASSLKEFRDRSFNMVALNAQGKRVQTPITTDFGSKDWNDDWFIFREFYSNAVDERNHTMEIVASPSGQANETSVFLPYERFQEYHKNLSDYFTDKCGMWIGSGRVYRQNVFVGKMEGTTISFNSPYVKINECRTMDEMDVKRKVSSLLACCVSAEVWTEFFKSTTTFKDSIISCCPWDIAVYKAIHAGLIAVYGADYCIVPNVNSIIRDAEAMGMVPVILPVGLQFDSPELRDYLKMDNTKAIRKMNDAEQAKYNTIRNKISAFIPLSIEIDVKVFAEGLENVMGEAVVGSKEIKIRDTMFNDEHQLMHTIIHEIGHIITRAGDYDRQFTAFFVDALCNLAK